MCLAALLVLLVSSCGHRERGFVHVENGQFVRDGKIINFIGTNFWYGPILGSEGRGGNRTRLEKELDILKELGLTRAMSMDAELFGLSKEGLPLYINQVLQKAKVITNEHGTKAAAMTQVTIMMTSARPVEKKKLYLDRPFFYMILDTETGIPLFTGAVYNPAAE